MTTSGLKMTSNVGRDVLQTALLFSDTEGVVWEYLTNGLEYRAKTDKRPPTVRITTDRKKRSISIADNGHGMDQKRIIRFLTMHGEQIDDELSTERIMKRGLHGTGKSAAFAIANSMTLETVHNGKKNKFKLTREMLANSDGGDIPVDWLITEEETEEENGTTVIIEDISTQHDINSEQIITHIEKLSGAIYSVMYPRILVDGQACEKREIEIHQTFIFPTDQNIEDIFGAIELKLNVARIPLNDDEIGVKISTGPGRLVAIETLGLGNKECGNFIFGEINAPALEEEIDGIRAYTQTRDLKLNLNHRNAKKLITFLGAKTEEVRKIVLKGKREKQESERGRQLERLNNEISEILNDSFKEKFKELKKLRELAKIGGTAQALDSENQDEEGDSEVNVTGWDFRAEEESGGIRFGESQPEPINPKEPPPKELVDDEEGTKTANKSTAKRKRRKGAGLSIETQDLGPNQPRYVYIKKELTIYVNLTHPSVSHAYLNADKKVDDIHFKRLIFEIAFTAYILAYAQERIDADPLIDAYSLRYDMQELYDDITLKTASSLYG